MPNQEAGLSHDHRMCRAVLHAMMRLVAEDRFPRIWDPIGFGVIATKAREKGAEDEDYRLP
jgi:hypothetical protein